MLQRKLLRNADIRLDARFVWKILPTLHFLYNYINQNWLVYMRMQRKRITVSVERDTDLP